MTAKPFKSRCARCGADIVVAQVRDFDGLIHPVELNWSRTGAYRRKGENERGPVFERDRQNVYVNHSLTCRKRA